MPNVTYILYIKTRPAEDILLNTLLSSLLWSSVSSHDVDSMFM